MDVNTGGNFTGGPAEAVVELSAAEALAGVTKAVAVPPDGTPVLLYFPPGAHDGAVLNVGLPWTDPATGAATTRNVSVTIRVLPAGPFPQFGPPPPAPAHPGFAAPAQPRFGTRTRVIAVVVGVVLVGGICLVPTLFRGSDAATGNRVSGGTTTTQPVQEATPTPTPPPLDAKAFQLALDEANSQLTAGLATLRKATTPRTVGAAADDLAETARSQASTLSTLTVPAEATAAHSDLVSALFFLEEALTAVSGSAGDRSVCTGVSATAALSRAGAAADLRTAVTALGAADPAAKYRFGSFLPAVTKDQKRRKTNGSYLTRTTGGSGQLSTDNGNAEDTVIKLVKSGSKKPAVAVYVRGKKKVTTGRIKDGTYQIYLASGTDWDGKRFTRNCGFSKFDSSFKFTTTSRQYTIWRISLKVRAGGNATSTDVDPDAFPN
ncbi:hypothetical protein [Actinoplanes derwentensis]|nr:hypothetical protein [Actinoplanes derwentensis]